MFTLFKVARSWSDVTGGGSLADPQTFLMYLLIQITPLRKDTQDIFKYNYLSTHKIVIFKIIVGKRKYNNT